MPNTSQLPMIHYDYAATALVVFDMLEAYRGPIEAAGTLAPTARLIQACRRVEVPIFYARADHRADGADFARTMSDTDPQFRPWGRMNGPPTAPRFASGTPESAVLAEITPQPGDYDVPKHRWSAFRGTHLELSLRSRGVDTILLVGGSTHVGIASTAFDARDRDLQVTIVGDCCHGHQEQRAFFLEKVFPRMCNVRSVDEVIRGLEPQSIVRLAAGQRV